MGWQTQACPAVDPAGARCALAAGHEGEHRTATLVASNERSAWVWRILIAVGVGLVVVYGLSGIRL